MLKNFNTLAGRTNRPIKLTYFIYECDNKYYPLCIEINELGFSTKIIVLVIGSLGHVHSKFIRGLTKIGINKKEAKMLTKYCSISAVIGSSKVWKTRCRLDLNSQ